MTNKKDVQHQVAPDLEQDVVIEHPIIVTIIVITILQGSLRDLKEVGQLEQLVLFLKFTVHHQVNGTFILVFGTHMLETSLPEHMFLLPELRSSCLDAHRTVFSFSPLDRSGRHQVTPTRDSLRSQPVTPNQANIRSWLKNHQDDRHPMMDSMVKFVAQILDYTTPGILLIICPQ